MSTPALFGSFLFIHGSGDLGTLVFSLSITTLCALVVFKTISTSRDGVLTIDAKGIWLEQSIDALALNSKKPLERTHVAWKHIQSVDVGYGVEQPKQVAPAHVPLEPEKQNRKSRFMAHMSGQDWSLMIDHNSPRPVHLYAANMNQPEQAGEALGLALWKRNLIASESDEE